MYSSMSTGESKCACSQSIRSISSLIELTTALNSMPIEPSSRAGLTMTGKCRSWEKSSRPRKLLANTGVWMPWNAKIFFATALSCASIRPCVPVPVYFFPSSSRNAGNLEVGRVVVRKRLGEVEHQVAFEPGEAEQALQRPVELVEDRLVAELGQRFGDLLLDLLLVERAHDGRLLGGAGGLFLLVNEHPVVEDDDFEFAHMPGPTLMSASTSARSAR